MSVKLLRRLFDRESEISEAHMTSSEPETVFIDSPPAHSESVDAAAHAPEPASKDQWHSSQPFRAGYATHVGWVRTRNEDSILALTLALLGEMTDLSFGLFMVADGMGGHSEGQKASQLATRIVAKEVMARLYGPFLQVDDSDTPGPVLTILTESLQLANWRINRENPQSGTTLTVGLIVGSRLYIAHVGDSRAYLIDGTDTDSELLTLDHSFVQRLQDSGQISPEEALVHPQRNILYRAIGQGERLEIDTFSRVIPRPGWLLLCSDGLWGVLTAETLVDTVIALQDPQQICDELVSAALEAGAPDNISAIVIQFDDHGPRSARSGTGTEH
jgi:serine/threonine protein phosphatase PrpC